MQEIFTVQMSEKSKVLGYFSTYDKAVAFNKQHLEGKAKVFNHYVM